MTLEEKAEEYFIKNFKQSNNIIDEVSEIEKAYKDGYEQGQKAKSLEVICKDCSIQKQISKQCDDLLKENAELKEKLNRLIEILNRIDNAEHADFEDYGCKVMEILNDEGHNFWNEWIENDE